MYNEKSRGGPLGCYSGTSNNPMIFYITLIGRDQHHTRFVDFTKGDVRVRRAGLRGYEGRCRYIGFSILKNAMNYGIVPKIV